MLSLQLCIWDKLERVVDTTRRVWGEDTAFSLYWRTPSCRMPSENLNRVGDTTYTGKRESVMTAAETYATLVDDAKAQRVRLHREESPGARWDREVAQRFS